MATILTTSPGTALSERASLENRIVSASLRSMRMFLAGVERDAVAALSSPVVLAAGFELDDLEEAVVEPFTLGKVARRWRTVTERMLDEFPEWLPPTYRTAVEGRMQQHPLPGEAYDSVKSVLTEATESRWSRSRILQQLSRVLEPSTGTTWPRPSDPVGINWDAQVRRIARTEATAAYGFASNRAMAADPDTAQKMWVSAGDRHVRKSHAAASGQTVAVSEPFLVGSAVLMYPGDPSGPLNETTNCRCVVVAK